MNKVFPGRGGSIHPLNGGQGGIGASVLATSGVMEMRFGESQAVAMIGSTGRREC
jgi:hypothetical protein